MADGKGVNDASRERPRLAVELFIVLPGGGSPRRGRRKGGLETVGVEPLMVRGRSLGWDSLQRGWRAGWECFPRARGGDRGARYRC